ncbi:hypothetical protein ACPWT1_08010 [Ramlibacter sp. MMS24-I3-19]|uniref:hypothetical protein n=1 Tax=Ramlibacter sp. MMS24-I3-19 TaxID=3416606 RepID=UPI003D055E2F
MFVTLLVAAVLGTACTQMPTEKVGVSDLRPQVSFKLASPDLGAAQVLVDGLDMGQASQYVDGSASLRLIPGTHDLQVFWGGRTVLSERFYAADGVNKSFVLK